VSYIPDFRRKIK